jgi:hypothetical protein
MKKKIDKEIVKNTFGYFGEGDLSLIPNPKLHQLLSFIKSAIRIVGYVLIPIHLLSAALVLILSEVIGIIEEMV